MKKAFNILFALIIVLVILLPVIWLVLASFKTRVDLLHLPPKLLFSPTFDNYVDAIITKEFYKTIFNSLIVSISSSALIILLAAPLSFLISRKKIRNSFLLFFSILTTRMAPSIAIALPLFWLFTNLGLIDTYLALILTHFVINFAIGIWILRVVFDRIPTQIEEAGLIDGLSFYSAFIRLIVPNAMQGILIAFFILFIFSWNEMLISFLISGFDKRPVTSAVIGLVTPHGTNWGQIAAISTIALVPVLIFILTWRKSISRL